MEMTAAQRVLAGLGEGTVLAMVATSERALEFHWLLAAEGAVTSRHESQPSFLHRMADGSAVIEAEGRCSVAPFGSPIQVRP